ncbi:hypothetical protein NRS6094_04373 [Bacillus subtilis]|uniref:hypothetical protein n=1 Tax=Bacillus subtilis TaxID=1423 RepID=UPI001BA3B451|nr:hypothetical protein [Bacillus subtilis]CAF1778633.1 hypothetical protein NRS6094_04373 [Bacillus subtilis]
MAIERIVADVDPEIKRKAEDLKQATGKAVKTIISELIEQEYDRVIKGGKRNDN